LHSSTVNKFDPAHNLFDLSTDKNNGQYFNVEEQNQLSKLEVNTLI